MRIEWRPVAQGMSLGEVRERVATGWIKVGRQAISQNQQLIVDPSSPIPPGGVIDVDIWMQMEPMVSVSTVVRVMIERYNAGDDGIALDNLSRALFGVGINIVEEQLGKALKGESAND